MAKMPPPGIDITICPSCHNQVEPGHKFCQICGTKIEEHPVCPSCHTAYLVPVKFCEVCGSPMDAASDEVAAGEIAEETPDPPHEIDEPPPKQKSPARKLTLPQRERQYQEEPAVPPMSRLPPKKIASPPPEDLPESIDDILMIAPEDIPALPRSETPQNTRSAADTTPAAKDGLRPEKRPPKAARSPLKLPANLALIIGGIIAVLVIVAGVNFIGLPLIQGSSSPIVPPVIQAPPAATPTATLAATPPPTPVPTPEPVSVAPPVPTATIDPMATIHTQVFPKGQEVYFQVQKDPVTSRITIIFAGGPGINAISSADVRVTHADGTVLTGMIKPSQGNTELVLDGSRQGDRVEVIANMHNGQTYRVIDEIFSYKGRE